MADALGVEASQLNETSELNTDNWDSLAHIAAISAFDEKFGVTVSAKELTSARNVGEVMKLVEQSVAAQSADS